ncbi:MAG TPA: hypothetical protein VHX49_02130 [Candidatus Acidoferrales bacterium]|jgi:putative transposase|nr:hypothetical protein [Candidatus Acidoferrales bacterium]
MKHRLERRYGSRDLHFITCSCYHRLPLLGAKATRTLFLDILSDVRNRYDFALLGYVVMPNIFTCSSASRASALLRL